MTEYEQKLLELEKYRIDQTLKIERDKVRAMNRAAAAKEEEARVLSVNGCGRRGSDDYHDIFGFY